MKKTWSDVPKDIIHEVKELISQKVAILLVQPGKETRMVTIVNLVKSSTGVLLECNKGGEYHLGTIDGPAYLFYKKSGQALMRGFVVDLARESQQLFRIRPPREIFEVQRRQHHRVFTPRGSMLSCAPKNTRRMLTAEVLDVSMEGARIYGLLVGVENNTVLSPITMVLSFDDRRSEPITVNISEAKVVRIVRKGEKVEVAFCFASADSDVSLLQKYIDLRVIEQKV